MNAEMPLRPAARSVTAITTMTSPMRPCVMNVFDPLSTQHVAGARRRRAHAGGVAAGGRFGQPPGAELLAARERRRETAASAPRCRTGRCARSRDRCARRPTARRSDRRARAPRCRCSSRSPTCPRRRTARDTGCPAGRAPRASASARPRNAAPRSHSRTCGRISVSANSRTLRRSSSCSSVGRKSMNPRS